MQLYACAPESVLYSFSTKYQNLQNYINTRYSNTKTQPPLSNLTLAFSLKNEDGPTGYAFSIF